MAPATTVRLPRFRKARFPESCVGCGGANPRSGITIWTWSVGWWALVTALALFWSRTARTRAPACRRCAWALRFRRLGSFAVFAALLVLAVAVSVHLPVKVPKWVGKLVAAALAVVFLIPVGIWSYYHPPSLELTLVGEEVEYAFRDFVYACEFAEMNLAEIET